MRILMFTGKGGVGKTTVAASTAVRLAEAGQRVLALSTDPAHSLGDSFGVPLGSSPTPVMEGLDALEIDALVENDAAWESLRAYLGSLLTKGRAASLVEEEVLLLPGLTELFSLLRILDYSSSDAYDVLVIDCAPTGETLSLLRYPERLERLFATALPVKRAALKVLGRPMEKLTGIPMPEDRLFDDVMGLLDRLTRLGILLRDGEITTMRLVTTPERIVVSEARRAYTWLSMYGFCVDAVVVNRVYPERALRGYFAPFAESQHAGLTLLAQSFGHLRMFAAELSDAEVVGLEGLGSFASRLYGGDDPATVFYRGEFSRVLHAGDDLELHLRLPQADKTQLDLRTDGTDLILAYRNEERRFALPDSLVGREVTRARYTEEELVLTMGHGST